MGARITAIRQGTEEWLDARQGIATGSKFSNIMTRDRSRGELSFGVGAHKYAMQIASERFIPDRTPSYTSYEMQWGHDNEPNAIEAYEDDNLVTVRSGAFLVHDKYPIGFSTDGLVDDIEGPGILEVKCLQPPNHAALCIGLKDFPDKADEVLSDYMDQMQAYMWGTERNFCDFVGFHPWAPKNMRKIQARVYPNADYFKTIEKRVGLFMALVDEYARKLGVCDWEPFHVKNKLIAFPVGWNDKTGLFEAVE